MYRVTRLCRTIAAVMWVVTLVAFVAFTALGCQGMDTNIGAGLALIAAMDLTLVSDVITLLMLASWVTARRQPGAVELRRGIRNTLWGAVAVTLAGTAVYLLHFPPQSSGATRLYVSLALCASAAVLLSRDHRTRGHPRRGRTRRGRRSR